MLSNLKPMQNEIRNIGDFIRTSIKRPTDKLTIRVNLMIKGIQT